MSRPQPDIIRGRMTDADRAEIERLALAMNNPTPGKIALKIRRHVATVTWYMLTHGLLERKAGHASRVYTRGGLTIYPYTAEHDRRIETLRIQGKIYREIADALTSEFGIKRTAHSVQVRMVQLAASPDEVAA